MLPILDKFHYSTPIQIRWNDLDPLGHVNNSLYCTYFEIVRGSYMLTASPSWSWDKDMFLIASMEVAFYKELTLRATHTTAYCRMSKLGTKSFEVEYAITSMDSKGQTILHALGKSTQVLFNVKEKITMEIPSWLREELALFENTTK